MTGGESEVTIAFHGIQLGVSLGTLYFIFQQHKIWIRMKDRINEMYVDFCEKHGLKFKPLDANGGKD